MENGLFVKYNKKTSYFEEEKIKNNDNNTENKKIKREDRRKDNKIT